MQSLEAVINSLCFSTNSMQLMLSTWPRQVWITESQGQGQSHFDHSRKQFSFHHYSLIMCLLTLKQHVYHQDKAKPSTPLITDTYTLGGLLLLPSDNNQRCQTGRWSQSCLLRSAWYHPRCPPRCLWWPWCWSWLPSLWTMEKFISMIQLISLTDIEKGYEWS